MLTLMEKKTPIYFRPCLHQLKTEIIYNLTVKWKAIGNYVTELCE